MLQNLRSLPPLVTQCHTSSTTSPAPLTCDVIYGCPLRGMCYQYPFYSVTFPVSLPISPLPFASRVTLFSITRFSAPIQPRTIPICPLITTYHPGLHSFRLILKESHHILLSDPFASNLSSAPFLPISFCYPPSTHRQNQPQSPAPLYYLWFLTLLEIPL